MPIHFRRTFKRTELIYKNCFLWSAFQSWATFSKSGHRIQVSWVTIGGNIVAVQWTIIYHFCCPTRLKLELRLLTIRPINSIYYLRHYMGQIRYTMTIFLVLVAPWIGPSGLFPLTVNLKTINHTDSWCDSLEKGSTHRKTGPYTDHKYRNNANISMPQALFEPRRRCSRQWRRFMVYTTQPLIHINIVRFEVSLTNNRRSVRRLLVTVNVHSSPILVTLMMEALSSSVTSVLTRVTWRNIPEDAILHINIVNMWKKLNPQTWILNKRLSKNITSHYLQNEHLRYLGSKTGPENYSWNPRFKNFTRRPTIMIEVFVISLNPSRQMLDLYLETGYDCFVSCPS
jgi:hypothetical protein